jgi:hypothetical protein
VDDKALWASERARVYGDCCDKVVVLLGDCRTQLGLVPSALEAELPGYRAVHLAVEETSPVAALRDLAEDPRFAGTVICGLNARLLCKDLWQGQQPFVDYYHNEHSLNQKLNRLMATAVQRHLTVAHPFLRFDDLVVHLVKQRRLPAPYYIETHADRSRLADYSGVDLQAHTAWAVGRAQWLCANRVLPALPKWLYDLEELESSVEAIQARGGRVIFVRFPTTAEHLRYDEWMFPKRRYWDAFADKTAAECIHFADVPALATFQCPDSSHLDRTDAPRFTRALAQTLRDRELIAPTACAAAAEATDCACRHPLKRLLAPKPCACCQASDHAAIAAANRST